MCGFKIICENGLWQFAIIPSNNSKQPMGYSTEYNSRAECEQAVHAFKSLVKEKLINSADSSFVRIDKDKDSGKYVYKYFDESEKLLFTSRLLSKVNAKKAVSSIFSKYVNSPILQD